MYLDDVPYEYEEIPITEIRVRHFGDKWIVEYRREEIRYFWDRFWWYDDSIHSVYVEAAARANVLYANGYAERVIKRGKRFKIETLTIDEE
jgi:hypothetical protein